MSVTPIQKQVYSSGTIFKMVLPLILSLMIEQVIGFTDVAFLGRVGEIELGASALGGVMFLALVMVGFGYSFSLQAFMGQKNGEKAYRDIGLAFHNGSYFLLAISLALFVVALFASRPFLALVCETPEIAVATDQYFFWRVAGVPFIYIGAVYRSFFIATLRPRILTVASVVMALANVVLDYVLIFGFGPVPALGITGAAVASSLSEVISVAVYAVYTARFVDTRKYGLFEGLRFDRVIQKKLFVLGRWLMIQESTAFIVWLYFFVAIEHLGPAALAISNVVRQTSSMFFLLIHSFGSTAGAICANLIGERRFDEIPGICRRALIITVLCCSPCFAIVVLMPEKILGIFTNLPEIISGGVSTLYVLLGSFVFTIPCMFLNFSMAGMGLTRETSVATLTAALLYVIYIYIVTQYPVTVEVIWGAEYLYNAAVGAVCWYFFRQRRWRTL